MLKQRIITAVVLVLALILLTTNLSPFSFSLLITLMVLIAAFEWTSFIGLTSVQAKSGYIASVLILLAGLYFLLELNPQTDIHIKQKQHQEGEKHKTFLNLHQIAYQTDSAKHQGDGV